MTYIDFHNVAYDIYKSSMANRNLTCNEQCLKLIKSVFIGSLFTTLRLLKQMNFDRRTRITYIQEIKHLIQKEKLSPYIKGKLLILTFSTFYN